MPTYEYECQACPDCLRERECCEVDREPDADEGRKKP